MSHPDATPMDATPTDATPTDAVPPVAAPAEAPLFADGPEHLDDDRTWFARTRAPAPDGWDRLDKGTWVNLRPTGARLPRQGWKVHASATLADAERVVDTVWEYCVAHGIAFKFLRGTAILHQVDGKPAPRSSGGKLVTLYPADETVLDLTLKELSPLLHGVRGPYVLNDLRWGGGPLFVRYGAFEERYCFSPEGAYVAAVERPDGVLVPDTRGASFQVPDWVEVPASVQEQIDAARAERAGAFPFRVEKVLRFSNGGGVYRAVERDTGRTVVLREARPHAGLDLHGADAVARLVREHATLVRLDGLGGRAPKAYGRLRHWEHHYLVEEFVEGEPLHEAVGRRHPLLRPGPTEDEIAAYAAWAHTTYTRIEEALAALHARGVALGDLKPGNVMVRPDGSVCLVDFETAHDVRGTGARPALATEGFSAPWAPTGVAADEYALACVRLALYLPLTELLRFAPGGSHDPGDPGKHRQLVAAAARRFPVPDDFAPALLRRLTPPPTARTPYTGETPYTGDTGDTSYADTPYDDIPYDDIPHAGTPDVRARGWGEGGDRDALLDGLRDAITASATPDREDRLFPGDVRQFDHQGAAFAFGAAGVLHALHRTGRADHPGFAEHTAWLVRAARRTRWPRPGLYDGVAGVAYVLDELGLRAEAHEALDRLDAFDPHRCGSGLFGGLAGIGLTLLHFAADGRDSGTGRAVALGRELVHRLGADPGTPGLLHGWSGPALFFIRLATATGDPSWLRHAETALARDLGRLGVPRGNRLQARTGPRWDTALGHGSAGIGLALDAYLRVRDDPHLAGVRDRVRDGLDTELLLNAGLLNGQAGVLLACAHLGAPTATHLRSLGLHAVRYRRHPAFALDGRLRLSMDLATGTAGVLLAAHAAHTGVTAHALPFLTIGP
ncbi:serine/threonine protein kinase [Streptomyces longispororuber]|uniref:non-specific serine/threonine protein kinase n=1 Tax=Streptomyces longispororuber TaxID=68230 RepID=A0A919DK38_9ACTN|nr:class III lanthionine synthetase LanKC [Streptomyces longispororuber]GHE53006.1 serine/threonine protein kinase [Streptomyces longispororuber]